ncbi:hypothetical protein FRC10_010242 [Ceratobasidium sp. 414]|nr:hypothetical protein FRC10_010242 [Ceratobasidium sp. 414]
MSPGSYEPAPCLSLLPEGLDPTRPSSAVAPIRGFADGVPTSATPAPLPLSTAPASPTLSIDLAQPAPNPAATPLPAAVLTAGEGVVSLLLATLIIYPTMFPAAGIPDGRLSWASQYIWVLVWTLPLAGYLGIGIGLYLAPPKDAEISDVLKIFRLLKDLGDLPHLMDEHDVSPSQLRTHVELLARARRSVYGERTAEPEVPSAQGDASPNIHRLSHARVPLTTSTSSAGTRGTTVPPGGLAAMAEGSSTLAARLARLPAEMWAQDARVESALEEPFEAIRGAPRWDDRSMESNAPVMGSLTERRRTEIRARENVSPLAHKDVRRTGELVLGGALPTPESLRPPTDDLEDAAAGFIPTATSTPPRARLAGSSARRMARPRPARSADPTRSNAPLSPSRHEPLSLRSHADPSAAGHVLFGMLAERYPPRPNAPQPDTTVSDSGILSLASSSSDEL